MANIVDPVEELRQLRIRVMRDFDDGLAPFWMEYLDLARHEFETRISQNLQQRQISGENHLALLTRAMADYNEHWREQ